MRNEFRVGCCKGDKAQKFKIFLFWWQNRPFWNRSFSGIDDELSASVFLSISKMEFNKIHNLILIVDTACAVKMAFFPTQLVWNVGILGALPGCHSSYRIEGKAVGLIDGRNERVAAPGSASKITTAIFEKLKAYSEDGLPLETWKKAMCPMWYVTHEKVTARLFNRFLPWIITIIYQLFMLYYMNKYSSKTGTLLIPPGAT